MTRADEIRTVLRRYDVGYLFAVDGPKMWLWCDGVPIALYDTEREAHSARDERIVRDLLAGEG